MIVSYHWLCSLLGDDLGVERVASRLTLAGLEVEHVEHVGGHLRDVLVAEVLSSRPHPSSKNPLTLVTVRAEGDPVEIVCGASNVPPPGGRVAFARLGATVFDKNGRSVTLEARPVAGVMSVGMLCAEDELGLGADHAGILHLDAGLAPGTPLSALDGMTDTLLTLNVTPNRGDALSHWGIAREVAALFGRRWTPTPLGTRAAEAEESAQHFVQVRIDDAARCGRYIASTVLGVTVAPSPLATRVRLARLGVRSINNVVDVTNLVMLETGQPLHAFDHRKVRGRQIVVRRAQEGEALPTLDGEVRALSTDDLVIADAVGALALAGVMGGEHSGVTDDTRDVVLECASFDPRGVRRTARRLGMRSESSYRFERGTDASQLARVAEHAAHLLARVSGARVARGAVDVVARRESPRVLPLRSGRTRALLGAAIDRSDEVHALEALGFGVRSTGDDLEVTVPAHRSDIAREVDLIEEVGRVWGIERIPPSLPATRGARAGVTRDWRVRRRLRETLCALGLDEAIHMVFTSSRELAAAGFDADKAIRLANPLSDERSHLRPSLVPKLVAAAGLARRRGEARVRLYEVGSTFEASQETLPREETRIAMVMSGARDTWLSRPEEVDFYDLKGLLEELIERVTHAAPTFDREGEAPAWAHPCAWARVNVGDRVAGVVAMAHPDVIERADLGRATALAELDLACIATPLRTLAARAPSRFPASRRDVALLVAQRVSAGDVLARLRALAGSLCESVTLFDRYEGKELPAGTHSLAFSLTFRAEDRTLLDSEVDALVDTVTRDAREHFGAAQR